MLKVIKPLILLIILISSFSCKYVRLQDEISSLKDENLILKEKISDLEEMNNRLLSLQSQKSESEYIFCLIKTMNVLETVNGVTTKTERQTHVSNIEKVINLTDEKEFRMLDDFQATLYVGYARKVISREVLKYKSYKEASESRNKYLSY